MIKFTKTQKLNKVLNSIYEDLQNLGIEEIRRYATEFNEQIDFNIAQYGNLLIYYWQVRELYKDYKTLSKATDTTLWKLYKSQVGYVARYILKGGK